MSGASRFFNAKKGGYNMACKHERIKSENCVISCIDCGAILPIDYLVAKDRIKAQNEQPKEEQEQPAEPKKRASRKGGK